MKPICIGDMKTFVTVEALTGVPDGDGGFKTGWSCVHEAWAMVTPTTGHRKVIADRAEKQVTHKFYIRYDASVKLDGETRVRLTDSQGTVRVYRVETLIDVDFNHEFWELGALEGVVT